MKRLLKLLLLAVLTFPLSSCNSQQRSDDHYTYKSGDWNGIGKWYMGREIARVMGYQGMSWLERPEREKEERTSLLLKNMDIQSEDVIADIGAGSGYHVFKMAKLAEDGLVYAVDIQEEMLAEIKRKIEDNDIKNVRPVKGSEKSVNLPENSVDKVLIVDVYHEISFPKELMASLYSSMRKDAQLYLIEYRAEDATVPIKEIHKMSELQAVKEMRAAGFRLKENIDNLPWQHCMVFIKE
ncbi:MAG: class I SAM-dependent methyltransferase [Eudoraea sp.]|nr:class I SAM-dependent methyltransferase [Eudoraea sp.]